MSEAIARLIREVKERTDIADVIGEHVALSRTGQSLKGLCPFHEEKTPSFYVTPARGTFHCFGCGVGGDAISFLEQHEGLDFLEALERLATDAGLSMPERSCGRDEADHAKAEKREALLAVHEFALGFYRSALPGSAAESYLRRRGLAAANVDRFALGVTPEGWTPLLDAAKAKGFGAGLLIEAGLAKEASNGRLIDLFRGRLMIPIRDQRGRVIAFGGRRLDDSDTRSPKYVNSPQTELFDKSATLYGLDLAYQEIGRRGQAVVVEGYFDAIACHAAGHANVVATLGTALGRPHGRLLRRYTERVVMLYDGDAAGQKAVLGAGEALLAEGLDARVATLPPGKDPDDLVAADGPGALAGLVEAPRDFFAFALDEIAAGFDLSSIAGQSGFVSAAGGLVLAVPSPVGKEAALRLLAIRTGLPLDVVRQGAVAPAERRPRGRERPPQRQPQVPFEPLSLAALRLALCDPNALEVIRAEIDPDWVIDARVRPWIESATATAEGPGELLEIWRSPERRPAGGDVAAVSAALNSPYPIGTPVKAAQQVIARLKSHSHRRRAREALAEPPSERSLAIVHGEMTLALVRK
ncbi:MAG: DNA primase [Sumerlaeia bacterium]